VGDLSDAPQIPDGSFDCAIVTQTLQFIYDTRGALATLERILAPGGVLLATTPGLTKISPTEDAAYGEWWHYTARSLRRLAAEAFGESNVEVESYGNVLAAAGFLYGLAASDLSESELDVHDPLYEVVVGLRAVKLG
jgi:ubiquinone/menaquinone biosynthesis C-methylase UbiE